MTTGAAKDNFGFLIQDVSRLMRRDFNRKVQDLGLTQAQWRILLRVACMEGARQAEIADVLEMQPISVARMIDRMEAAGWVERRADPDDRRAVNIFLTAQAEPILDEMRLRAAETRKTALKGVPAEQQGQLSDLLQKIRNNLANEESSNV